MKINSIKPYL